MCGSAAKIKLVQAEDTPPAPEILFTGQQIATGGLIAIGIWNMIDLASCALASLLLGVCEMKGWIVPRLQLLAVWAASLLLFYEALLVGSATRDVARWWFGVKTNVFNSFWKKEEHCLPEAHPLLTLLVWTSVPLFFTAFPSGLYWLSGQLAKPTVDKYLVFFAASVVICLIGNACGSFKRVFRPKNSPPDTVVLGIFGRVLSCLS